MLVHPFVHAYMVQVASNTLADRAARWRRRMTSWQLC